MTESSSTKKLSIYSNSNGIFAHSVAGNREIPPNTTCKMTAIDFGTYCTISEPAKKDTKKDTSIPSTGLSLFIKMTLDKLGASGNVQALEMTFKGPTTSNFRETLRTMKNDSAISVTFNFSDAGVKSITIPATKAAALAVSASSAASATTTQH